MKYIKENTSQDGISQIAIFMILCMVASFVLFSFFSVYLYGLISLVIAFVLLFFACCIDMESILLALPSAFFCILSLCMLFVSGRWGERGFWAPIFHAYKYIYLFLVHTMGIVMRFLTAKQKKIVVAAAFFSAVCTSLYSSYFVFTIDQNAMRNAQHFGVADFNIVYGIMLITIVVFSALLFCKEKAGWNLFLLCCFLSFAVMIMSSLFTTALLLFLSGLGACLLVKIYEKYGTKAVIIMGVLMFFLVFVIYLFSESISEWLYNNTEDLNSIIRVRVRSVADKVLNTEHDLGGYNADRRGELAGYSLHTFMANPLFGVGYTGFGYGIIGNHQEWQDMLGVFGIVGSAFLVTTLITIIYQIYRKNNTKEDRVSFTIALLLFTVLGFLNPCFSPQVLMAVFFIAPNVSIFSSMKEERVYELKEYKYIRNYA